MLTYTDKITHKTIEFNASDIFTIKTKSGHNRYITRKVFTADKIDLAVSEFYSLIVPIGHYKYLFKHPEGRHHQKGDLVLRMRGHAKINLSPDELALKTIRVPKNYAISSIANLNNCPKSLAEDLAALNKLNFPASLSRWSYQKIVYCLLSHFVSLSEEDKYNLLQNAEKLFDQHKIKSGQNSDDSKIVRVDVVAKEDLL